GAELDWNGHRVCLYVENQTGYRNLCRILNTVAGSGLRQRSMSGDRFPLTPALSPRERGNRRLRMNGSKGPRFFERLDTILPLPEGEGRGEGKETQHSKFKVQSSEFDVRCSMFSLFDHTDGLLAVSANPARAS